MPELSFCESTHASGTSPWHIRELTDQGRKLGGGADTKALCGREVAWDIEAEITHRGLDGACQRCVREIQMRYAGDIWDILVATCGAAADDKECFVGIVPEEHMRRLEYRFCGDLGFGGKVYIDNPPRVSCYPEPPLWGPYR